MNGTCAINIQTDLGTQRRVEEIFGALGLSTSDAVNIFFEKVIREGGLSFISEQDLAAYVNQANHMTYLKFQRALAEKAGCVSEEEIANYIRQTRRFHTHHR